MGVIPDPDRCSGPPRCARLQSLVQKGRRHRPGFCPAICKAGLKRRRLFPGIRAESKEETHGYGRSGGTLRLELDQGCNLANADIAAIDNIHEKQRFANPVPSMTDWKTARFAWARAVRKDARLSDGAKLLADVLCYDFGFNESGVCNPSIDTLAQAIGKSDRAVQRALAELRAAAWINVRHCHGRGKRSEIHFLKGDGTVAFVASEKVTQLSDHRPEKVTDVAGKGDRSVTPYNKAESNRNKKERGPNRESPERPSPHLTAVVLLGSHAENDWNDWLARHKLPNLKFMDRKSSNAKGRGWDMPFSLPPSPDDSITTAIAVKFANWAAYQKGFIQ